MRLAPIAITLTAAAILIVSCNRTPTTPSVISQATQPPPPPAGPVDVRLEIIGPRSVAPGATAQFNAIMHRSDNTTQDVTNTATWRSSRTNVLTIAANGVAAAVAAGDAFIQASVNTRGSSREIIVTPDGTFRLIGSVVESESSTTPIVGAQVEVVGVPAVSATSDSQGRYRLYGISANPQIRITKNGYVPRVENLTVTDHQTQNFALSWAGPRPDVSGTYMLTITLADRCRASYPEETFSRTYTAVAVQSGPALTVTLAGATFAVDRNGKGNRFGGRVEPSQVVFQLSFYDYYYGGYADLVEEISSTLYYIVSGTATIANATPNRLSGSLNGSIMTISADPRPRPNPPGRSCTATDHQFVLSR
jgi:hypothetical protein